MDLGAWCLRLNNLKNKAVSQRNKKPRFSRSQSSKHELVRDRQYNGTKYKSARFKDLLICGIVAYAVYDLATQIHKFREIIEEE